MRSSCQRACHRSSDRSRTSTTPAWSGSTVPAQVANAGPSPTLSAPGRWGNRRMPPGPGYRAPARRHVAVPRTRPQSALAVRPAARAQPLPTCSAPASGASTTVPPASCPAAGTPARSRPCPGWTRPARGSSSSCAHSSPWSTTDCRGCRHTAIRQHAWGILRDGPAGRSQPVRASYQIRTGEAILERYGVSGQISPESRSVGNPPGFAGTHPPRPGPTLPPPKSFALHPHCELATGRRPMWRATVWGGTRRLRSLPRRARRGSRPAARSLPSCCGAAFPRRRSASRAGRFGRRRRLSH